jgi:four helix bundle protein
MRKVHFSHDRLDVYRLSLEYVAWAISLCRELSGEHRYSKDQLMRASQSIPMNIAEGNGKGTRRDKTRFFEIARGSALECAAIQDVLEVADGLTSERSAAGKALLVRIVSMLTKLSSRDFENGVKDDHDHDYAHAHEAAMTES